ncbi:uncharacterized protein LY89DRAFT_787808 [Mollisia scopiformis]|uniref:Copper acquisition factor BIM1-like domain-containing protein n=1 Tax=Mollisia scopiformis TaxID=149040 RepID=A0A132BEB3_MOLSC|nr:uncharacterized protein LY89DRAFT_787808 [Mollisia scopiformis]KUJ10184.1 hypothetical protein LY89DRAFT_787808 [Mollisia scopiformis]
MQLSVILFLCSSLIALSNAHFVLQSPVSLGYYDVAEATGPCDTFNLTNRDNVTSWRVAGYPVHVLTTHNKVVFEYRVPLLNDTNTWVNIIPPIQETGVGDFCLPAVPGYPPWCAAIVFSTDNAAPVPPACRKSSDVAAVVTSYASTVPFGTLLVTSSISMSMSMPTGTIPASTTATAFQNTTTTQASKTSSASASAATTSKVVSGAETGIKIQTIFGWWTLSAAILGAWMALATLYCAGTIAAQSTSKYPTYNFTQQVDHSGNNSATFNQSYQLVTDFFRAGGPILFLQGAEQGISSSPIENDIIMDWAEELGAALAVLEHRFFGTSIPESFDGSLASFAPLSLDNVMEDAVSFIEFIQKSVPGAANSKAIVTGGSYGGNLALVFRVKHPETFYGSFASAPLTESFGPLASNTDKFRASEALSNIYYDASTLAAQRIQSAMLQFYGKNCTEAIPDLNLCGPAPNATQFPALYGASISTYRYAALFNYPIPAVYAPPYPLQYLINATLAASTPGEVLRIPLAMTNWQEDLSECVNWSSPNITGQLAGVSIADSWFYLQCQYYPISESAVPPGDLLPPTDVTTRVEVCSNPEWESSIYNSSNEFWQQYLGTADEIVDNTTRLLILQGGYDRDQGVGMPNLTLTDDRQHSRVIFTSGLGHTEDMFGESVLPRGVRPQLDAVRDTKLEYLKQWLGMYDAANLWNATTVSSSTSSSSSASSSSTSTSASWKIGYNLLNMLVGLVSSVFLFHLFA